MKVKSRCKGVCSVKRKSASDENGLVEDETSKRFEVEDVTLYDVYKK